LNPRTAERENLSAVFVLGLRSIEDCPFGIESAQG